jgi:hypothetical protein
MSDTWPPRGIIIPPCVRERLGALEAEIERRQLAAGEADRMHDIEVERNERLLDAVEELKQVLRMTLQYLPHRDEAPGFRARIDAALELPNAKVSQPHGGNATPL